MTNPRKETGSSAQEAIRPSLYGGGASDTTAEIFSILDALEPPPKKATWLRRLGMALLLAVAAAGIVAAASNRYGYMTPAKVWLQTAIKRDSKLLPTVSTTQQEVLRQAAAEPAAVQERLVAPTVNEASADNTERPAPPSAEAQEIAVEAGPSTKAVSVEEKPMPAKGTAKSASREKSEVRKGANHGLVAASDPARASVQERGKDKDVDLIAALLSHVSRGGSGKEAAKTGATAPSAAGTTSPVKRERQQEPNRDVVLRSPGEPIDALLKRCQTLGFFEGQLCRMRICADLWGKDPACPGASSSFPN
jgi:hypothetical protein